MRRSSQYTFIVYFAAALALSSACSTRYRIRLTTYLSDGKPISNETGSKVAIITESDPKEPLLEKEVKKKLQILLESNGFETTEPQHADFLLGALFSIDSGSEKVYSSSSYRPGGFSTFGYYSNNQLKTGIVNHSGSYKTKVRSRTIFNRSLGLILYDRVSSRKAKIANDLEGVCWSGTAYSLGSSSDIRRVIDYLLVATMEKFGQDTEKEIRLTMYEDDERVVSLRRAFMEQNKSTASRNLCGHRPRL